MREKYLLIFADICGYPKNYFGRKQRPSICRYIINIIANYPQGKAGIYTKKHKHEKSADICECRFCSLSVELSEDIPFLRGDSLRIRQILLNLIGNAVKFSNPQGRVVVRAVLEAGGVVLAVEDNGIGISEKDLDHIIHPFIQAASSQTRGHEGTGLGLSLVKSLTELHGGMMEIDSKLGTGTTVTVRFPAERTITASAA